MLPIRKRLPHQPPSWIDPTQEAFFITINAKRRGMNQFATDLHWSIILESIMFREARGDWHWNLILAMPDHIHGIVLFPERFHMSKQIEEWKRWLARHFKLEWQDGFFEHRLRSEESAQEKADYIRMNPVRAGLTPEADSWPYVRDWKRN